MSILAKIYPNGETSLHFQRRLKKKQIRVPRPRDDRQYRHFLDFKDKYGGSAALEAQNDARRGGRPLGLVTAPNSTKTAESRPPCRGLTRLGARTLRQGAYIIEREHGKDQITFCTLTVPRVTDEELGTLWQGWSAVVDRIVKRIRYQLTSRGLSGEVIHVTEIQPNRMQNTGQEVPHLHLVFQGRKRKRSWIISPKQIQKWWKSALKLPYSSGRSFTASTQLSRVKSSVQRYLSKYLAKTGTEKTDSTSRSNWRSRFTGSWWGCTDSLRQWIKKNSCVLTWEVSSTLWRSHEEENREIWEYQGTISNPWAGGDIVFCRFGRLTPKAQGVFGRPLLDRARYKYLPRERRWEGLT